MSESCHQFDYQSEAYPHFHFRMQAKSGETWASGTVFDMMHDPPTECARLSIKCDGCAHIGLRDPELGHNWTHVCGSLTMERYLCMLQWAWNTLAGLIPVENSECGLVENVSEPNVVDE